MKIAIVDDEEKYLDRIEKSVGDFFQKRTGRNIQVHIRKGFVDGAYERRIL